MAIRTRKLKNGRTAYDVLLRRPDGTQYAQTFYSKKEAQTWEAQQKADRSRDKWVDPAGGRILLRDYTAEWLRNRKLRPRTRETYDSQLKHILAAFGDTPLSGISRRAVREWFARTSEQVSPLQASKCYRLLMAILNTAVEDDLIGKNRCRIKGAAQEHSEERPLVPLKKALALADAIEPRYRLLVLVAIGCGLRMGELMGLRRMDANLFSRRLRVYEQQQELRDAGIARTEPKTEAGKREVRIPNFLIPELKEHLRQYVGPEPEAPLFTGPRGGQRRATVYKAWRKALVAVGLPIDTHPQDFRHLSNTLAAKTQGITLRDLMERMGHKSQQAALRYLHSTEEADDEMADELDAAVDRARSDERGEAKDAG